MLGCTDRGHAPTALSITACQLTTGMGAAPGTADLILRSQSFQALHGLQTPAMLFSVQLVFHQPGQACHECS